MRFGEIDIPQEVISELEAGRLVVFAGAGVSSDPPSSLPLFGKLADQLAAGTKLKRWEPIAHNKNSEKSQPIDRFLGQLEKAGVDVKARTRDILVGDHTKPNALHASVVKLFGSGDKVRLVTTNFDTHFSTSLAQAYADPVDVYQAPALPLGSDFSGLVYLHGCAERSARQCVITDEDFGKAYLTEGWARRFLIPMFQSFTVLFIGYSHDDPVMNYLARGLPPATRHRRFAITSSGRESEWAFLDIHPCTYTKRTTGNKHGALTDCLTKWAAHSQSSFLDRFHRIRRLAEGVPPKDPEEQDFVMACINDAKLLNQFVERALSEEWLLWVAEKGLLKKLFQGDALLGDSDRLFAWWLARLQIGKHTSAILKIFLDYDGGVLHPHLCREIAGMLWALRNDPDFAKVFREWVCVLLAQPSSSLSASEWAQLLSACSQMGDLPLVPLLLERSTEFSVRASKPWSLETSKKPDTPVFSISVNLQREVEYSLQEAWEKVIQPNLSQLAELIEPIVTHRLVSNHLIAKASSSYDRLNFHRHSVEPHQQDQFPDDIAILIDIARDLIASAQQSNPRYAEAVINRWLGHSTPLLTRLAVHALARQPSLSADQKIEWCVGRQLLFSFPAKTEVFFLLKMVYGETTDEARIRLLDQIEQGPQDESHRDFSEDDRRHLVFQRIGWISQCHPECEVAAARFSRLKLTHPSEWLGPHPDLHSWIGDVGFSSLGEGQDLESIFEQPPSAYLDRVRCANDSARFEDRRMNLAATISILIAQKFDWGLELQKTARITEIVDEDIWTHICQGWRDAKIQDDQWPALLEEFHAPNNPPQFYRSIVDTLEAWTRKDSKQPPLQYLESLDELALKAWDIALGHDQLKDDSSDDWVFLAINRPGGKFAEYLFTRIDRNRKANLSTERLFEGINKALRGSSGSAKLASLLIASQARWFRAIAPELARDEIVPRFAWSRDAKDAEQAWQGFLQIGHWTPELADELKDSFTETIKRLGTGKYSKRIGGHLASLCFWIYQSPLAGNWLYQAIEYLDSEGRVKFAIQLRRCMKEASEAEVSERWDRWISEYWRSRNRGVPVLMAEEACQMAGWAFYAGAKSSEAVELARLPFSMSEGGRFPAIHELRESKMLDEHPSEAADLLLLFLANPPRWLRWGEDTKAIWQKLKNADISPPLLKSVREAFARVIGIDPEEACQS